MKYIIALGGDTDEEKGKDSTYDALASLYNKTKLYYLQLTGNVNLKWVGYLSNDTQLKYLYFGSTSASPSCYNMIDTEVAKLRTIFSNCGENKTYPGKYWLALLDDTDTSLEVNLYGQTITQSQFESLSTYTNIKYLNLRNLKITVSDSDSTVITDQDTINTLVTDTLKYITNLKYLNLQVASSSYSLYNLDDLSFLKGVDEKDSSDDIMLIELGCLGTKVSTHRLNGTSYETYDYGLKLLSTKRYGLSTVYSTSMKNLQVSESHIELGEINETMKTLLPSGSASYFNGISQRGFYTNNATVASTVSDCYGYTSFASKIVNLDGAVLDLRGNTSLTTISTGASVKCTIYLPSSVTTFNNYGLSDSGFVDFSLVTSLRLSIRNTLSYESLFKELCTISKDCCITSLEVYWSVPFTGQNTNFNVFKAVYEKLGYKLQIQSIIDYVEDANSSAEIVSLDGLEYITGLESIKSIGGYVNKLKDVSALESQKDTLTYVALVGSAITDLSVFSKLTNVYYLNLSDGSLPNYTVDDNGNKVYNLQILAALNANISGATGSLTTLYLNNCSSITNWSDLTSLSWTKFEYSN